MCATALAGETMRLTPGSKAPPLKATAVDGSVVDTEAWAANGQVVWIGFFRFASCPLCNLRVHQMISVWSRYADACRYVAVFQSPSERLQPVLDRHQPPFPIIADPENEHFIRFGVESSVVAALHPTPIADMGRAVREGIPLGLTSPKDGASFRVPADFIVAPSGNLHLTHYGDHISHSLPFDEADAALTALAGGGENGRRLI